MTTIDFNTLPKDGESLFNLAQEKKLTVETMEGFRMIAEIITRAAELGYPEAQFELASFHLKGSGGVEKDLGLALDFITAAANNGLTLAQRDLGIKAYEGFVGESDFEEAIKWFSIADELGDMESKCWLGIMHIEGKGFSKSVSLGHSLISWAAKNGCRKAHLELAYMYEFGTGAILIDTDKAEDCFFYANDLFGSWPDKKISKKELLPLDKRVYPEDKHHWSGRWDDLHPRLKYERTIKNFWLPAAQRGYPEAQRQFAERWKDRKELANLGLPEIQQTSEYWYRCSANQGYARGQLDLANFLRNRVIVNLEEVFYWADLAAKQDNVAAQILVGQMHRDGQAIDPSGLLAQDWFSKAISLGSYIAAHELGVMYLLGNGIEEDYERALELITKAADNQVSDAQYELAILYYYAIYPKNDIESAAYWYGCATASRQNQKVSASPSVTSRSIMAANIQEDERWLAVAAARGHSQAQYSLALMYEKNDPVTSHSRRKRKNIMSLYEAASASGLAVASFQLGLLYRDGNILFQHKNWAVHYFKMALSQGNPDAQACISEMESKRLLKKQESSVGEVWFAQSYIEGFSSLPSVVPSSVKRHQQVLNQLEIQVERQLNVPDKVADTRVMRQVLDAFHVGHIVEWGNILVIPEIRDAHLAFKWANILAHRKDGKGQCILGQLYETGIGTEQNLVLAHHWYNCAAYFNAIGAEMFRNFVEKHMTQSEIETAQDLSYIFCRDE